MPRSNRSVEVRRRRVIGDVQAFASKGAEDRAAFVDLLRWEATTDAVRRALQVQLRGETSVTDYRRKPIYG